MVENNEKGEQQHLHLNLRRAQLFTADVLGKVRRDWTDGGRLTSAWLLPEVLPLQNPPAFKVLQCVAMEMNMSFKYEWMDAGMQIYQLTVKCTCNAFFFFNTAQNIPNLRALQ